MSAHSPLLFPYNIYCLSTYPKSPETSPCQTHHDIERAQTFSVPQNRVSQLGTLSRDTRVTRLGPMITVRSAGLKGLGVFATTNIPRGTRIFAETPVFGIRADQGPKHVYPAFKALQSDVKATIRALSAHTTRELGLMRWVHVLWYTVSTLTVPRMDGLRKHKRLLDMFRSNAFSLNGGTRYEQAIFPDIARLNHECIPNSQANFNDGADAMHVHTIRDIRADEELTLSYLDDAGEMTTGARQEKLESYGFVCGCTICTIGSAEAIESVARRQAMLDVTSALSHTNSQTLDTPSKNLELQALLKVMALMRSEGLVGRELAARYAVAAEWHHELGETEKARICGSEGLDIDEHVLGLDHETFLRNKAKVEGYERDLQPSENEVNHAAKMDAFGSS